MYVGHVRFACANPSGPAARIGEYVVVRSPKRETEVAHVLPQAIVDNAGYAGGAMGAPECRSGVNAAQFFPGFGPFWGFPGWGFGFPGFGVPGWGFGPWGFGRPWGFGFGRPWGFGPWGFGRPWGFGFGRPWF